MAGGGFHVEFGINETTLTQSLEKGEYALAESLIRENANPSYLDEGCYQRTPLYIVLCGLDAEELNVKPRNLFLAKLCIERGANVNHRVPKVYYGSEFMGPGKSPMELLIDFYNTITRYLEWTKSDRLSVNECWNPYNDIVIGFNNKIVENLQEIKETCEQLMFIILALGGNPNVCDEDHRTPLHNLAIRGFDTEMAKLLYENGGNLNALDDDRNTPLLCLSDISICEMDSKRLEDLSPTSSDDTFEDNLTIEGMKNEFFQFFIRQRDVDLNVRNREGQTALFHCMLRGDPSSCYQLLKRGADPSIRATVMQNPKRKRKLSPLFSMFLSISAQKALCWLNSYRHLIAVPRKFYHLVDSGFFTTADVVSELQELLREDFSEFVHLNPIAKQLLHMLFGQTTASLKQLTTRVIFEEYFRNNIRRIAKLLSDETRLIYENMSDICDHDIYEEFVTTVLNKELLGRFIRHFSLPYDSLLNFETELLLQRMVVLFSSFQVGTTSLLFERQIPYNSSSDDSDLFANEEEGDSDLEYW